jgi:uncharacterized protein involved in exopolysaccharide biosynthesis
MQSLETITCGDQRELRRIVASSQTELQRAVETEQELASQMAVAKSRAMDQSVEFVTLRELERKANATREIYEAFLHPLARDQRTLQPVDPQCPGHFTGRGATATRWARRASSSPLAE